MSEESIKNITKSDSNFAPTFLNHDLLPDIDLDGHCLINNNISIPNKVKNLSIFYILNPWLKNVSTDLL